MKILNQLSTRLRFTTGTLLCLGALLLLAHGEVLQAVQRALQPAAPRAGAHRTAAAPIAAPLQTGGNFGLPQTVLAGGGGESSGGAFLAQGTAGQPLTAVSNGNGITIESGFWPNGVNGGGQQCEPVVISPATLPNGTVSTPYSQQLTATGGIPPARPTGTPTPRPAAPNGGGGFIFTTPGPLPPGLMLSSAGLISGTPTTAGVYTFTVTATDSDFVCSGERAYTITINAAPPTPTPTPPVLANYPNASVLLSGNTSVTPSAAPANTTSLTAATSTSFKGTFAANPLTGVVRVTDAHPVGAYTVTVTACSAGGMVTKTFTLTVQPPASCPALAFANAPSLSAGVNPIAVAVADFNNDGRQDLAFANNNSSVLIRLGDGAGNFSGVTNVSTGSGPSALAVGIFNGDGKQDFAASNGNASSLAVRLGDGAGNFSNAPDVSVGDTPTAVAVGDFNSDGKQDFATANSGTDNVTVRLNNCTSNTPPTIAAATLTRQQGSPAINSTSATVGDANQAANTLAVTVAPLAGAGVTVANLAIDAAGNVTANVAASCTAVNSTFTLTVTDNANATATAVLTVNVTANTPLLLSYGNQAVTAGGALNVTPAQATDNGTITGYQIVSVVPALNVTPTVNAAGIVMFANVNPVGNHVVTVRATDNCGLPTDASFTLAVGCPSVTINPATLPNGVQGTLPNGVQGTLYNQTLTASPAGTAYSYAVTTGALPTGLTLNNNGALSGTPSAPGNYAFALTATGVGGCTGTQSYNLLITGTCAPLTLTPVTLPGATVGTTYNQPLTAAGGTAPYTFTVMTGALPNGLTLDANTGVLSGTPTAGGGFTFTIKATGQGGCTGQRFYSLSVACVPVAFSPATLPDGARGVPYSQQLSVGPGNGYAFSLLLGQFPPGFTLSNAGLISGSTASAGTFNVTIKVLAGSCQSTKAYMLVIGGGTAALAMSGDYDGDGKRDLALWSASDGVWRIIKSSNQQALTQGWGAAGDLTLLGDYDGDGKSDLAVFRPSAGAFYIKRSSDDGVLAKAWGLATDVPVPGDYDGDGKTDIAVWRGSEGHWYIVRSSDGAIDNVAWGAAYAPYNDVPVPGDYDGDGKTDVAVFRRATGTWLIKRSSDGQFSSKVWGLGTDVPVAADYDGDGKTDIAVWRGAEGAWYIWQSATNDYRASTWGSANEPYRDQAVPGDYDGDGKADVAVWRASEARYLSCSSDGSMRQQPLGRSGDTTVPRKP